MQLTYKSFYITDKPYLTNKLEFKTLIKILNSDLSVVDGIYKLANHAKSKIILFDVDKINKCELNAYVKINYAYAGQARAQVANIKTFRQLIKKRPFYELKISIYTESQKQIFNFNQKYTRFNQLIDQISNQKNILENFINENIIETK